jgi:hypothetical protein
MASLMKKSGILIILAVALLSLNMADLVTTWFVISSGKGIEANPIALMLGGPLSPVELFLKVVAFPATVLGLTWYLARKFKDPRLGMVTLLAPVVVYATAVANNVMVAAKKVEKTALKAVKNAK